MGQLLRATRLSEFVPHVNPYTPEAATLSDRAVRDLNARLRVAPRSCSWPPAWMTDAREPGCDDDRGLDPAWLAEINELRTIR